METLWILLACTTLFTGSQSFQFTGTVTNGSTLTVCNHQDVEIPWDFTLDSGERALDRKWLFIGTGQEVLVAVYTAGTFLPSPEWSGRVERLGETGIRLQNVKTTDSGTFIVEVNVESQDQSHHPRRSLANVTVLDESLASQGAMVRATQSREPSYDPSTGQYHIQLTCASMSIDMTPSSVIWATPMVHYVVDRNSTDGVFTLLIPNPVKGGDYTCKVDPNSPAARCLQPNNPVLQGSTVTVDEMEARISLLEIQQRVLKAENEYLRGIAHRVYFDARLSGSQAVQDQDVLVLDDLVSSEGGGYSTQTGRFLVSEPGTYFFAATVSSPGYGAHTENYAKVEMMVDNNVVSSIYTRSTDYHAMGTGTAVVKLTTGQQVYLRAKDSGIFDNRMTSFTGFLLYPDAF